MSSRFERVEAQVVYEAKVATIMKGTFRHEDGDTAEREWAEMKGAVGIVAHDGERLWLVRQPREATGEPDLLELPAGRPCPVAERVATAPCRCVGMIRAL